MEQLQLELTSIQNSLSDEEKFQQSEYNKALLRKERFIELNADNENMKICVESLELKLRSGRLEHATEMHEMNKNMRLLRQSMESKLVRELTSIDIFYQKEAFESLPVEKKKAMFENAKLKDEVALQGIGMANLGSRLTKQNYNYESCQEEWKLLSKRSNVLREKLSELTLVKNNQTEAQKKIETDIDNLIAEQQTLMNELNERPTQFEYMALKKELLLKINEQNLYAAKWEKRLQLIEKLMEDLQPSSRAEANGHYNSKVFKFDEAVLATMPSIAKRMATLERTGHSPTAEEPLGMKPTDLNSLLAADPEFATAMLPLKGKESYLVKTYGDENQEPDQNMVAWVVLEILKIWRSVTTDSISTALGHSDNADNALIDSASIAETSSDQHEKSQSDDDFSEDFKDARSDADVGSTFQATAASWIKAAPILQRVPAPEMHLFQSTKAFKSQNVFLTAIQSPYQFLEVGPPVITKPVYSAENVVLPPLNVESSRSRRATTAPSTPQTPDFRTVDISNRSRNQSADPHATNRSSKTVPVVLSKKEDAVQVAKRSKSLLPIHKIKEAAEHLSRTTALPTRPLDALAHSLSLSALQTKKSNLWSKD